MDESSVEDSTLKITDLTDGISFPIKLKDALETSPPLVQLDWNRDFTMLSLTADY